MKKNGFAPLILILVIAILGVVGYFGYKYFKDSPTTTVNISDSTTNWKIFSNSKFAFSIQYPSTVRTESKIQAPSGSIHEYFFTDDTELFRLHVNSIEYPSGTDFYKETVTIGNNSFDIFLYPAGLDTGDFGITEPILYYNINYRNNKYAFQFNNQTELNELQEQILSTFTFTK